MTTKAIEKPKTKAIEKPKAVAVKKATQEEATESIKSLKAMLIGSRATWEAPLNDMLNAPSIDTLKKFYEAVGKDQLKAMREHHTAFIKGKGTFTTPQNVLDELPKDIAALMYTSTWPTMKADELSVLAKRYVPEFAPLYTAYSIDGVLRPLSDTGRPSRPAASFIAAKIGYAIIRGF